MVQAYTYSYRHIVTIFGLLAVLIVSNLYIMIPLIGNVATTFTITTTEASLSISIFSFFYAFGLIFFGALSERWGLKETICSGLLVLIILMIASYFMTNFTTFLIFRGLQGFWAASFAPVSFIYVLNVLAQKHQGITIGVINTGFLSAGVIGQLLSSTVNLLFVWQGIFITLGILYFLLLIYSLKKLPQPQKQKNGRTLQQTFTLLLKLPFRFALRRLYFITFTTLLSFVAFYTALENLFLHYNVVSQNTMLLIRGIGLIGLVITVYTEKIAQKFGYIHSIFIGLLLKLIGVLVTSLVNLSFIALGSIIFVAGVALVIPSLIQLIGVRGGENRGLAISLYSFILLLGASFGSLISLFSSYFMQLLALFLLLTVSLLFTIVEKLKTS